MLDCTLFDYGVGNLHSLRKAVERAGAAVTVTKDAADLLDAPAILLPGVGAFGACMESLAGHQDALRQRLEAGVPTLAVCIGMQLLFEGSEESPGVPGIGLLKGTVKRFPSEVGKVPHMGWNHMRRSKGPSASEAATANGVLPPDDTHVYYVHSYYLPAESPGTVATTTYGIPFAAAATTHNVFATQFHPEKSSKSGLELIARWVRQAQEVVTSNVPV